MELILLFLTLIAAVLVGYIVGKGSIASPPIQRQSSIDEQTNDSSSSSSQPKKSKKDRQVPPVSIPAAAAAASSTPTDATSPPPFLHTMRTPITETPGNQPTPAAATPSSVSETKKDGDDISLTENEAGRDRSSSISSGDEDDEGNPRTSTSRRIVIVAKQLPVITRKDPVTGAWSVEWEDNRSFVSGLRSLRARGFDVKWVGVPNNPGGPIAKDEQDDYEEMVAEHDCVPVFLMPSLADKFFNGFCKGVLWPMLHYVLPQNNQQFSAQWDDLWQAYTAANALFASVISHCVDSPTDTIWIHNYHLLLLPSFLRTKLPRAKIGLFIHTPFPSSDVFRVLPTRQNILSSIMASDLLGFHTFDYARHFLSCIKRVNDLDFETLPGGALGIKYNGRFVSILISHVGIDSAMFTQAAHSQYVAAKVEALRLKYGSRKIVIGAGDLDSVKGGLLKIQAYDRFLAKFPQWIGKMVFVEVLLPNRSMHFDHTKDMAVLMHEQVKQMQTKYGPECIDLLELPEQMPLNDAVAYFAAADVCVVSTQRDGLNLVPYEYTASQTDSNPGALVISEFMGCSRSLNGVLRVNPWSLDSVAGALQVALSMGLEERRANHSRRYNYVIHHTIERWAIGFLEHLERATKLCEGMSYVQVGWGSNVKLMGLRSDFTHLDEETVTVAYRRADRRVLLLDYDGTLTSAEKTAHKSRLMGPTKQVKKLLQSLTRDTDNIVFIMSGRTRSTLAEWFPESEYPELGLAAEKGLFLRWPSRLAFSCRQDLRRDLTLRKRVEAAQLEKIARLQANANLTSEIRAQAFQAKQAKLTVSDDETENEPAALTKDPATSSGDAHLLIDDDALPVNDFEWECMIALDDVSWKSMALEIIRSYAEQTDGSWIEDKEFAIVFHYEQADPEYGRMQASELQKYLIKILANPNVDVVRYDYNRILEVKPRGVSKGLAATAILEEAFQMHNEKISKGVSSPTSPSSLMNIDETEMMGSRSRNSSHTNLASLGLATSPKTGLSKSLSPSSSSNGPFLFCVGDDRSDEDMFLSVQNKDYLEGKLRSAIQATFLHQHSMHGLSSTPIPHQDTLLKRSQSANAYHGRGHGSLMGKEKGLTSGDIDEKATREARRNRTADPFTFTVCVGMKPSNAHYYLHDDEEVVKLLSSLGVSSQRMAQTRAADIQALGAVPMPRTDSLPSTRAGTPAAPFGVLKQSSLSSIKQSPVAWQRKTLPVAAAKQVSDDDNDDDNDDDDGDDSEDEEFLRQQQAKKGRSLGGGGGLGGLRRM